MRENKSDRLFLLLAVALLAVTLLAAAGASWLRWGRGPDVEPAATPLAEATAPVTEQTAPPTVTATLLPSPAATTPAPATPTLPPTPTAAPQTYLVQPGDTLEAIATRFGYSVEELAALNGLADINQITAGAELRLPSPTTVGVTSEPAPTTTGATAEATQPLAPTAESSAPAPTTTQSAAVALPVTPFAPGARTLGVSFGGRPIEHYVFGDGPAQVVFVGAIHGGYEWNTANLAYAMVDYLGRNPGLVPDAVTLHIIPVANPDGLARVAPGWTTGPIPPPTGVISDTFSGRFNGRDVDLNRNFDCNWQPEAVWRDEPVDAGASAFSESETTALRDFFLEQSVAAVVFWHSAAGVVLPGACRPDTDAPSVALAEAYSVASGYPVQTALSYEISGDASDWLTTQGIPSIAIELTNHTAMEWDRNLAGTLAVLDYYAARCAAGECGATTDR